MALRKLLWVITLSCAAPTILSAADSVEDVEKRIVAKWTKIKTLSADMVMTIYGGGPAPLKSTGTLKLMVQDGVEKKRMTMAFDNPVQGQLGPIEQTVLFDGEYAWTIRKAPDGRQIVAKQKPDAMEGTPGGKETFAQLRETFELKSLPDASVDGRSTYVIEAIPKQPAGRGITKYHFYFDKDSGVLSKTVGFGTAAATPVNEILFTNIKLNPELDATQFVAKFDPETRVLDMTNPPTP